MDTFRGPNVWHRIKSCSFIFFCILEGIKLNMLNVINSSIQVQVSSYSAFMADLLLKNVPVNQKRGAMSV